MAQRREAAAVDLLAALSDAVDSGHFSLDLLERSCALFKADRGALVEIAESGAIGGRGWPYQPAPSLRAVLDRRCEEHPSVAALRRSPAACSRLREQFTLRELQRMPVYCEFMRPMGCRDQVAVTLRLHGHRLVALALTRVDAEFAEADRYLLTRLGGPLRHLYGAAQIKGLGARALTQRESALLALVADGYTDARIARQLGVSQRTVEKHLESVRSKLGANSRTAAVAAWLGWSSPSS
jgi:DNA-binding CsgD family transcriptional regulator